MIIRHTVCTPLGPWTQDHKLSSVKQEQNTAEVYAVPVLEASSPNSSVAGRVPLRFQQKVLPTSPAPGGLQLFLAAGSSSVGHSSASPPFHLL